MGSGPGGADTRDATHVTRLDSTGSRSPMEFPSAPQRVPRPRVPRTPPTRHFPAGFAHYISLDLYDDDATLSSILQQDDSPLR